MKQHYTSIAIALHWAIAILILGQIAGGYVMHNLPNSAAIKFDFYQLHKSFGLSIIVLTVIRLLWRVTHKAPSLPAAMPGWQKFVARGIHIAFYALLFLTPLAGWAMVSASPKDIPTFWFGLFQVPHLPFFEGVVDRAVIEEMFAERHEFLAYSILALLVLHVGAALKHGFVNRDGVLRSMAPNAAAFATILIIFTVLSVGVFSYLNKPAAIAPITRESAASRSVESIKKEAGVQEAVVEEIIEPQPGEQPVVEAVQSMAWVVDNSASSLRFVGYEKDQAFEGQFSDFTADIRFDPDRLSASRISVDVRTSSAMTGDQLRDTTIPGGEWFDVKTHPSATFTSTEMRRLDGNSYEADGVLTIKEFSRNIVLTFTVDINGDEALASGGADLIRTEYGLGVANEWLDGEGIALNVRVEFDIKAQRQRKP